MRCVFVCEFYASHARLDFTPNSEKKEEKNQHQIKPIRGTSKWAILVDALAFIYETSISMQHSGRLYLERRLFTANCVLCVPLTSLVFIVRFCCAMMRFGDDLEKRKRWWLIVNRCSALMLLTSNDGWIMNACKWVNPSRSNWHLFVEKLKPLPFPFFNMLMSFPLLPFQKTWRSHAT